MFSEVFRLLSKFTEKPVQSILLAVLAAVVLAVLLGSLAAWLRRRKETRPDGWWGLVAHEILSFGTLLKVAIGLAILTGICLHLKFESGEFVRLKGGTSQRNYEAVKTIWGVPHIQRELAVRLATFTTKYTDKDGLELDPEKLKATTMPVGYRKAEVEEVVPGEPVLEADHQVTLTKSPRRKGSALYPGFEVDCAFRYKVANVADKPLTAVFNFPLPVGQGLVDKVHVTLDDKSIDRNVVLQGECLTWRQPLAPGEEHAVAIRYYSRGLEYIQFDPGAGRTLKHYGVQMLLKGILPDQHSNPIGCMAPTKKPTLMPNGTDTLLEWNLDNAVTRQGLGTIVPGETQGGYYAGKMLASAPWGLILLLAMVVITCLILSRPVQWVPLAILAAGYYLCCLLTAYLADYPKVTLGWEIPFGLPGGLAVSGVVLTGLMALLYFIRVRGFVAWSAVVFFLLFVVLYPLLRICTDEGMRLTWLYVALLAYTVVLLVSRRKAPGPAAVRP